MLSSSERQERITRLERVPARLESIVVDINDDRLDTHYGDGKWTIRQVVHHLAESHAVGFIRMRLVLTEDNPTLITYEQERWAELADSTTMPITVSLSLLHVLHARWSFLLRSLTDDDWTRPCHHPEWGHLTLDDLLTTYADHGENHMKSIQSLRESKGW